VKAEPVHFRWKGLDFTGLDSFIDCPPDRPHPWVAPSSLRCNHLVIISSSFFALTIKYTPLMRYIPIFHSWSRISPHIAGIYATHYGSSIRPEGFSNLKNVHPANSHTRHSLCMALASTMKHAALSQPCKSVHPNIQSVNRSVQRQNQNRLSWGGQRKVVWAVSEHPSHKVCRARTLLCRIS
jgi:hypothetical protein